MELDNLSKVMFLMTFLWPCYLIISFFEVLISYHFKTRSLTNIQSSEWASIVLTDEEEDEGSWFDSPAWALSEWSLHVHPAPGVASPASLTIQRHLDLC